jgi:RNA polymerase sigma-70 factor, ECF subfamily
MQTETYLLTNEALPLDKRDLVEIYERYNLPLFRYASRLLGNADLAEECVAETFSRLLQAFKAGGGPRDNVQAYLYRVAHNWVTDYYRSNRKSLPLDMDLPADPFENPSAVVSFHLERERVRQALFRLNPEQRQVIVLRFFEDWPHDEIAALVGKTAEATRALQHRALAALRKMLIEQEAES